MDCRAPGEIYRVGGAVCVCARARRRAHRGRNRRRVGPGLAHLGRRRGVAGRAARLSVRRGAGGGGGASRLRLRSGDVERAAGRRAARRGARPCALLDRARARRRPPHVDLGRARARVRPRRRAGGRSAPGVGNPRRRRAVHARLRGAGAGRRADPVRAAARGKSGLPRARSGAGGGAALRPRSRPDAERLPHRRRRLAKIAAALASGRVDPGRLRLPPRSAGPESRASRGLAQGANPRARRSPARGVLAAPPPCRRSWPRCIRSRRCRRAMVTNPLRDQSA